MRIWGGHEPNVWRVGEYDPDATRADFKARCLDGENAGDVIALPDHAEAEDEFGDERDVLANGGDPDHPVNNLDPGVHTATQCNGAYEIVDTREFSGCGDDLSDVNDKTCVVVDPSALSSDSSRSLLYTNNLVYRNTVRSTLDSDAVDRNDAISAELTLNEPGTYFIACGFIFHTRDGMTGVINVEP